MEKRIILACRRILPVIVVFVLIFGLSPGVKAATSFKGKVITFVVGSSAGGGTDMWARLIAKHLGKYIPGKPNLVVRNMPAAGGLTSGNYAYQSKPNGLTFFVSSGGRVMSNILRPKGIEYRLEKMHPVYSSPIGLVYYVKPGLIKEPKDIMTAKGLIFGHTAPTSGTSSGFIWPKELLGFKTEKTVFGYRGSGDARMAFLSGEVNFSGGTTLDYNGAMKPYGDKGEAIPIYQSGMLDEIGNVVREQSAPDVPTVLELYEQVNGKKPSGPVWEICKLVVGAHTFGKCGLLPPQTPDEIKAIYHNAVAKMVKDPEFLAESEKLSPGAPHLFGKKLAKAYPAGVSGEPEVLGLMKRILNQKYGIVFD